MKNVIDLLFVKISGKCYLLRDLDSRLTFLQHMQNNFFEDFECRKLNTSQVFWRNSCKNILAFTIIYEDHFSNLKSASQNLVIIRVLLVVGKDPSANWNYFFHIREPQYQGARQYEVLKEMYLITNLDNWIDNSAAANVRNLHILQYCKVTGNGKMLLSKF